MGWDPCGVYSVCIVYRVLGLEVSCFHSICGVYKAFRAGPFGGVLSVCNVYGALRLEPSGIYSASSVYGASALNVFCAIYSVCSVYGVFWVRRLWHSQRLLHF